MNNETLTKITRRELGSFETGQTLTDQFAPFNAVIILHLRGSPDPGHLKKALETVQNRHPLLQVHIVKDNKRYAFDTEGTPEIPLQLVERQSEDQWMSAVEAELNTPIDISTGPLLRCSYIYSPSEEGEAELLFTFHHSIVDAASVESFCHEVLILSDKFRSNTGSHEQPQLPFLHSEECYFPKRFKGLRLKFRMSAFFIKQMINEGTFRFKTRKQRKPPIHDSGNCHICPIRISRDTTSALIRQTRRRRVTISSALNAALLLTAAKNLYGGKKVILRHYIFINLRPYLIPPITEGNLGSYHTIVVFDVRVDIGQESWALTKQINDQGHRVSKKGHKFLFPLVSANMMRMLLRSRSFRMGATALSYTGIHRFEKSYGKTEVCGGHAFVSNNVLGPEFTTQVSLMDGSFWWDNVYLDSDMDNRKAT